MPNALGIDFGLLRDKTDRVLIVLYLTPGVDVLADLTLALAEAAIIKHEHGNAGP
jgi:hypothetical protein